MNKTQQFTLVKPYSRIMAVSVLSGMAFLHPPQVFAAGVVGNGTPGSCTDAALTTALNGGGTVTFNCGSAPVTITINEKKISANTVIDGGNLVVLSGASARRLFNVAPAKNLTVQNLTLANGRTSRQGAAIYAPSENIITANNCRFNNNVATQLGEAGGGAIFSLVGLVSVNNSSFTGNQGSIGGAIRILNSNLKVAGSTFVDNKAVDTRLGNGGAIYVDGARGDSGYIDISKSTFKTNTATAYGGALFNNIYNNNKTTISNCLFTANSVGGGSNGQGGAIWSNGDPATGGHWLANTNNTTLTITHTTLAGNVAGTQGGGIWIARHPKGAVISNSTINGNRTLSSMGGGIVQGENGRLSVMNSTLTDNRVSGTYAMGGGAYINKLGSASFANVTVANNSANWQAGGIYGGANVALKNTILANNVALNGGNTWNIKHNCFEPMTNWGNNLQFPDPIDADCTSGILTADPKLDTLKNTGGSTLTRPLLTGSAASRKGANCLATDQRGSARPNPAGTYCDIGAFEAGF